MTVNYKSLESIDMGDSLVKPVGHIRRDKVPVTKSLYNVCYFMGKADDFIVARRFKKDPTRPLTTDIVLVAYSNWPSAIVVNEIAVQPLYDDKDLYPLVVDATHLALNALQKMYPNGHVIIHHDTFAPSTQLLKDIMKSR